MPIRPENVARYPKHWKAIRAAVLERARHCCEGSPKYPDCRIHNGWFRNNTTGETTKDAWITEGWALADGDSVTRIVLTIGHLDHTPEHCSMENLRAWCQRCHLNYDLAHHMQSAYRTRRMHKAIGELFE